jgi:hypothetical protein
MRRQGYDSSAQYDYDSNATSGLDVADDAKRQAFEKKKQAARVGGVVLIG